MFRNFFKDESGQGMVEYGLILALIAVVVITALSLMGEKVDGIFDQVNEKLDGEGGDS